MFDASKRNVYNAVSTDGRRLRCVLGSFPSFRFPKPILPGIVSRCLHITGIPRNIRNKAEVIFCYILDVTRIVMLFSIYEGWNFNCGNYLFTTDTK